LAGFDRVNYKLQGWGYPIFSEQTKTHQYSTLSGLKHSDTAINSGQPVYKHPLTSVPPEKVLSEVPKRAAATSHDAVGAGGSICRKALPSVPKLSSSNGEVGRHSPSYGPFPSPTMLKATRKPLLNLDAQRIVDGGIYHPPVNGEVGLATFAENIFPYVILSHN
jgi:hypothetical protein